MMNDILTTPDPDTGLLPDPQDYAADYEHFRYSIPSDRWGAPVGRQPISQPTTGRTRMPRYVPEPSYVNPEYNSDKQGLAERGPQPGGRRRTPRKKGTKKRHSKRQGHSKRRRYSKRRRH